MPRRPNFDNVKYYDCSAKENGNYLHPNDCTRFITCSNGRASDMACPDCDVNNIKGCQGNPYLVYDVKNDTCDWPNVTPCHNSSSTTAVPIPDPSPPPTEAPTHPPTETPTHPPTEASTDPPAPGDCKYAEGDPCNPNDCDQCDYCVNKKSFYYRCARVEPENPLKPATGTWVLEQCAEGDFVDDANPLAAKLTGGQCTPWDFLHEATKEKYKNDKNCIPDREKCEYGQNADQICGPNYWFKETTKSPKDERSCPTGNIWDQQRQNCKPCKQVDSCKDHATCI